MQERIKQLQAELESYEANKLKLENECGLHKKADQSRGQENKGSQGID